MGVPDDLAQGGDMAPVGGSPGFGEAEPDPLAGVAHGTALLDVARVSERGDVFAEGGLADVEKSLQLVIGHRVTVYGHDAGQP